MSAETHFEKAERINKKNEQDNVKVLAHFEKHASEPGYLEKEICGYVIQRGGPHGLDIKTPIFGYCPIHYNGEPWNIGVSWVLKWCVGGFAWLRFSSSDVFIGREATKYAKELFNK